MLDVARLANVSKTTVSYVITGSGYVSEERRARIELAIVRLGYEPNAFARSLSARRVSAIGVISADTSDAFVARVTSAVVAEASARGISVVVSSHNASASAQGSGRYPRRQPTKALIFIAGHDFSRDVLVALEEDHVVVLAGEVGPEVGAATVVIDPRPAAHELASLVAACGHTRVCVVGPRRHQWSLTERMVGLSEGLAAAGITPERITTVWEEVSVEGGRRAADQLFGDAWQRTDRSTAVLCVDDDIAIGVMQGCAQLGLSVPGHVSVTGFGDTPVASRVTPQLTTARIPAERVGHAAVQMLVRRVEASDEVTTVPAIPASAIRRGSVNRLT
jgi:LacI family transcriptional regulator